MRAQWTVYVTITIVVLAAIQFTMLVKPPTKVSQIVLNTDVHQFQRSESNAQFQHEPSQAMEFSSVPENAFVTEPLDTPVELAATRKNHGSDTLADSIRRTIWRHEQQMSQRILQAPQSTQPRPIPLVRETVRERDLRDGPARGKEPSESGADRTPGQQKTDVPAIIRSKSSPENQMQTQAREVERRRRGESDGKLIFIKFHQVGGTTLASRLMENAEANKQKVCCREGCDLCAEHASLACTENCLGIRARPVIITIMREPVDKALAKFYFQASRDDYSTGVAGFKESIEQYAKSCHKKEIKNQRCFNEYTEVLGDGGNSVASAKERLRKIHVIGKTEAFDDFMIMIAIRMSWSLEAVAYKRLKTVLNRPRVEDHSQEILSLLREKLSDDIKVYELGAQLATQNAESIPNIDELRQQFISVQSQVDQSCQFESHGSRKLIGKDCYRMPDTKTLGAQRVSPGSSRLTGRGEEPRATTGSQLGPVSGNFGSSSEGVGSGSNQVPVPSWCLDMKDKFNIQPGKSWGDMIEKKDRRQWKSMGCNQALL